MWRRIDQWLGGDPCQPKQQGGGEHSRGQAGSGNWDRRQANEDPEGRGGNVVGDRQDRETGTEDRRTRIQRDEAGNVVEDRQDRETGTEDRRTRIQRDEVGNVVGDRQDRENGNRRQANCWRDLHEPNSEDNLATGEQCSANL